MSTVRPVIRSFGGVVIDAPVTPDLGIGDMLLYYDFDDTSPTVEDKSGNSNGDQTLSGNISLSANALGSAAALVNVDGTSEGNSGAALDFEDESFSISFWIRYDGTPANADAMVIHSGSFSLFDLGFAIRWTTGAGGSLLFEIDYSEAGNASHFHSWTPSTSTWYHIVCICEDNGSSASTLRSYIDNSVSTDTAAKRPNAIAGVTPQLELMHWQGLNRLDGAIAKVRIFGKALSAGQVQTLYEEHSGDA